jgi:plastocyanin
LAVFGGSWKICCVFQYHKSTLVDYCTAIFLLKISFILLNALNCRSKSLARAMKNNLFTPVIILGISVAVATCTKSADTEAVGGDLPTNYITIQADGSFSPAILRVASGSSITFVNNDNEPHQLRSADSVSINTGIIAPSRSYFFKKDTLVGTIAYRCILDTNIRGTIIITP